MDELLLSAVALVQKLADTDRNDRLERVMLTLFLDPTTDQWAARADWSDRDCILSDQHVLPSEAVQNLINILTDRLSNQTAL